MTPNYSVYRTMDDLTGQVVVRMGNALDSVELGRGDNPTQALANSLRSLEATHSGVIKLIQDEDIPV